QGVSGQHFPSGTTYTDSRITAALMMSPSPPRIGDVSKAFGSVAIPWLIMTGTDDKSPIGLVEAADRLKVFPALPAGDKCELVLDGAEHSAFGDRPLPGDSKPRDPNHHKAILAISTAFFDTYLRQDSAARDWYTGKGPQSVLAKA